MADFLEFDSATEFQILETFDFEEEIRRPEALRFYTLDEQLIDYVEKSMPQGKASRFQIQEIQRERERIQNAYLSVIDSDFELKERRVQTMPSWIHPIHSDLELKKYNYQRELIPVLEQRTAPNYYSRMLVALPKPYVTKEEGNPTITENTKTVGKDREQIFALGNYERTKTILHEDGHIDILSIPIPSTHDDISIKGYALDKKPVDVPNPLIDHPFLSSAQPSELITNEPFLKVFPSIDAIMSHGVPTTTDPYIEGDKYLKIYNVNRSDITWDLWKRRFPPVTTIETPPTPISVAFPRNEIKAPSENLKKVYTRTYDGVDPHSWLMGQEDAGAFVPRMWLSKASESGLLPVNPLGELPDIHFPQSTPEECLHTGTFHEFLNSGLYRKGMCIPVSAIQHERDALVSRGRKAWIESTEHDILREYQILLHKSSHIALPQVEIKYTKYNALDVPEMRKEILLLMKDPKRLNVDKMKDILTLLQNILPKDKVYLDASGHFIICGHTIELLSDPEMEPFYREWTFVESGYRVCKFCGQQINRDVFLNTDDFDEAGHVIKYQDKLPTQIHHGETNISEFTKSLTDLKGSFQLESKHIGHAVLYMLLSLFQVVPLESQLLPVLTFMDGISGALKAANKGNEDTDGAIGIVGMAILLQTHNPFLIPRRSFGSRQLKLSGYPRDTDESKQIPVLNTILFVLQNTFESFPQTFKGGIATFMRALTTDMKKIRSTSISILNVAVKKFKAQYVDAKQRYDAIPEDVQIEQLKLPMIVSKKNVFLPSEVSAKEFVTECSAFGPLSYITCPLPPSIVQDPLPLQKNLRPSTMSIEVVPRTFKEIELTTISKDTIGKRISKKFPKKLKAPLLASFIDNENDGITLLMLISRLLDIFKKDMKSKVRELQSIQLETRISSNLLRDSVLGITYDFLNDISENEDYTRMLMNALKNDIVLRSLLMKKEDAEKEDQGLRARERELLKKRLREKNDAEREILKMLLDIGIAPYIITNVDREMMAKESDDSVIIESEEDRPEGEYDNIQDNDADGDIKDNENGMRGDDEYDNIGTQQVVEEY